MNKFSTHKWENYLKKSKVERSLTWIIDSYGINWDYVGRHQNQQGILCEEYRASPFSTCDTVTVVKLRAEKEISNSFYVNFMDLDINDMEKTMNFMVSYGVDQAEYYPYDAVSGSRLFTVDHLRTYHQDFRESALFLLNELQSSADKLEKAVFQSIRKDKLSGGRSSGWEKDVRTITNDIEKHLKRGGQGQHCCVCFFHDEQIFRFRNRRTLPPSRPSGERKINPPHPLGQALSRASLFQSRWGEPSRPAPSPRPCNAGKNCRSTRRSTGSCRTRRPCRTSSGHPVREARRRAAP